ncbi:copper amine oxidase N-terminal domain-containing protein [Lysinibacillus yapensis]|uniref:Copper amine oxidase N-terminal domain-containing protein n=1 Tax=Ureibacillus yapensis TaxID=2304605 RepID=A0A396SGK3_9BACL|nr:copper amine oxidase N-terminal domain-containing protein [Lysinibacillus yapensis]RHW38197.1 copper amine oxidase N-terminal domain-containing protein [Lysinibacillus yapensis]
MKKKNLLIVPALVMGLALPTISPTEASASENEIKVVHDGLVSNGRTLVPIRVISEEFGSKVDWNQNSKTVTVTDGKNEKVLKANSKTITVNGKSQTIDAPVTIKNGKTYVPLVVASPERSYTEWDNKNKSATITLDGKILIVRTNVIATNTISSKVADTRIFELIKKVNEIENLSSISQKRAYFKPYFTDAFINKIIDTGIEEYNHEFINLDVKQASAIGDTLITQSIGKPNDGYLTITLRRGISIKNVDGVWKVYSVDFRENIHDPQANG